MHILINGENEYMPASELTRLHKDSEYHSPLWSNQGENIEINIGVAVFF